MLASWTAQGRPERVLVWIALLALTLLLLRVPAAQAEVYRYKDANGRWQFTDRPPPELRARVGDDEGDAEQSAAPVYSKNDLAARLTEKFHPGDPIQQATLASVSIKGMFVQGAGFFVTDDGYVLTNRHVVRPDISEMMSDTLEEIDREDLRLQRQSHRYTPESLADARRKLREGRREIGWRAAAAASQQSFELKLKDGETHMAHLVAVSQDHDLALLKLDGLVTPTLTAAARRYPDQGQAVYAIGNPLGVGDSLTIGHVTRVASEQIFTDIQLLPGNSGGPLVNEDGELLGVNFAKMTQGGNANYQGFGLAVPIGLALEEFPEIGR